MQLPSCSLGVLAATTLLFTACTSTPQVATRAAPPAPTRPPAAAPETKPNLRKGMTEAEIRAAWGEPKGVHPGQNGETILVYQFDVRTTQRLVATDMVEVPAFDPVNGLPIKVTEPTYSAQNVTLIQTIALFLRDGALERWSRHLGEQRTFN
jgi:hypothetical protein